MTDQPPALTPFPLPLLLGRIAREWESRRTIFDLPPQRFFKASDLQADGGCDLSLTVGGHRVATPAGPAAGPHTQLAQNLVLGWLGGARTFELKTVQILDELQIARPCIDMATVGYNVEWSQELSLDQSLAEYAKAWLMLALLARWQPLREILGDPGGHAFELSVGYDLAGIQSERLTGFIAGLRDAEAVLAELKKQIPPPFTALAEILLSARIVDSATLSTFHGCPPEEIEAIVRHLVDVHDLNVTVKLNPTLLGYERVAEILHDQLGYHELQLLPAAFAEDLSYEQALGLIRRLDRHARARGRTFGIKLTNTLVVANHLGVLPGEQLYLSGPPLHILAIQLLVELAAGVPDLLRLGTRADGVPVAFSAGIDKSNFAAAVGLGLAPVTICSDLLKPGGYGRLAPMLRRLVASMHTTGCRDLAAWYAHAEQQAQAAGHRDAVSAYADALAENAGGRRYGRVATAKLPRTVPATLQLWDCCSCNLCVTVCPNDAMLRLATPAVLAGMLREKWQYVCLAELCNACGNCTTFCPEQGEPFRIKPRLYVQPARFERAEGTAFLVHPGRGNEPASAGDSRQLAVVATVTESAEAAPEPAFRNAKVADATLPDTAGRNAAAQDTTAILTELVNASEGLPFRAVDLPGQQQI